ncbi:MAG: hypothetical protein NC177_03015 [Ruminococcus flavefaciens]|nr:hypothetical protein [Ruminococcus flavefaciens]
MDIRETAHDIIDKFTDEQLQAFVTLFADVADDDIDDDVVVDWFDEEETSESEISPIKEEVRKGFDYSKIKFDDPEVQQFWDLAVSSYLSSPDKEMFDKMIEDSMNSIREKRKKSAQ